MNNKPKDEVKRPWYGIDERAPFYDQITFRVVICLTGLAILLSIGVLFCGSDSPWDRGVNWSASGFKEALILFSFPLKVLVMGAATAVMVSRFHRSKQFSENMKITESKNDFDRRFKHEEEFLKFIGSLKPVKIASDNLTRRGFEAFIQFDTNPNLYLTYFPDNKTSLDKDQLSVSIYNLNSLLQSTCKDVEGALSNYAKTQKDTVFFSGQSVSPVDSYIPFVSSFISQRLGIAITIQDSAGNIRDVPLDVNAEDTYLILKRAILLADQTGKFMRNRAELGQRRSIARRFGKLVPIFNIHVQLSKQVILPDE